MKQIFIVNRAFFFFYSVYVCDCVCVCTYTRLFSVYGCRILQVVLLSHAGCSHDEHRCAYCKLVSLTAFCLSVCHFVARLSGHCLCLTVHWSVGQSKHLRVYACVLHKTLHSLASPACFGFAVVRSRSCCRSSTQGVAKFGRGGEFTWKKGESYFCNLLGGKMNLIFVQPIDMHSDTDALSPSVRIACRVEQSACQCCGLL